MKKFIKKYLIPANDKLGHFYLWGLLYYAVVFLSIYFGFSRRWAFFITVISAFLKEFVHDGLMKKGTPGFKDFIAGSSIAFFDLIADNY